MPYTEKELEEIERDPVRLRAYVWHVAMNAQRIARRNREQSRKMALSHPVINYVPIHEEGRDLLRDADLMDRFSKALLDNIDLFVDTTVKCDTPQRQ